MARLLLIDNYDSFTWNLVQVIGAIDPGFPIDVVRNDRITVEEAEAMRPSHLMISPGPCTPAESGISPGLIRAMAGRIPILGVCLGHQAIGAVHGMTVARHTVLMHGKTSRIRHDGQGVFAGLPDPFVATRYHSLVVLRDTVPPAFAVSAWTDAGEVMGLRWRDAPPEAPMEGVQFHPESFLTTYGPWILANFLGLPRREISAMRA
ncbi:MAG: aminodeoxychorismate/anthranilate synthase component II [Phycisphaeraceae bacterium]|nr:aminodeoxychorismate/anthranilate synthase component II [Phycisphaeraceae bacterium]